MNTPGCPQGNWQWRAGEKELSAALARDIRTPQGNWQWRAGEKELSAALARDIRTLTARYFRTPCKT